jgi:hypothetical protein
MVLPITKETAEFVRKKWGNFGFRVIQKVLAADCVLKTGREKVRVSEYVGCGMQGCALRTDDGRILKFTDDRSEAAVWRASRKVKHQQGLPSVFWVGDMNGVSCVLREDIDPLVMQQSACRYSVSPRTARYVKAKAETWDYEYPETLFDQLCRGWEYGEEAKTEMLLSTLETLSNLEDLVFSMEEHVDLGASRNSLIEEFGYSYRGCVEELPDGIASSLKQTLLAFADENIFITDLHTGNIGWRKGSDDLLCFDMQCVTYE